MVSEPHLSVLRKITQKREDPWSPSFFYLQIQRETGIIKSMRLSNTERYHFFPSSLAHFADRSARGLLITPENVRTLVELVAEQIATFLDFSQLTALRSFLSETLRERRRGVLRLHVNLWLAEQQRWTEADVPSPQRRLRPILPILFYTGNTSWNLPLSPVSVIEVPEALTPFVPTFEVLLLSSTLPG